MADSGTAPRYRSQVITLADQLAIAVEDEVEQAGGAAVLFKYLLNPLKEPDGREARRGEGRVGVGLGGGEVGD